jgi:hypothetical protein
MEFWNEANKFYGDNWQKAKDLYKRAFDTFVKNRQWISALDVLYRYNACEFYLNNFIEARRSSLDLLKRSKELNS